MDVPQPNIVALVGTSWRFLKPVRPGATVHAVWRLGRKREVTNPRWGLVVWQVELMDHLAECVLEGDVSVLVNRHDAKPLPARGRRRRRGKTTADAMPADQADLPEPAPADTPTAAQRRRRRPSSGAIPAPPPAPEPAPALTPSPTALEDAVAVPAAPASSSARRRRRRRGGGGTGGNGNGSAVTQEQNGPLSPARPAPAPPAPETPSHRPNMEIITPKLAPEFERAPEPPPPSTWAAPLPSANPKGGEEGGPLGRVFGRLRRPRPATPGVPAPGDTRSPGE